MSLKTFKWYRSPPCASLLREEFPSQGVRNLKKTLPKALRTPTLTALTSNSSLVRFGRYGLGGLVGLVGSVSSRFFDILNSMIYDLKRSVHLRWLFDPVLHSSSDDLVILISLCCCCYCWGLWAHGFYPHLIKRAIAWPCRHQVRRWIQKRVEEQAVGRWALVGCEEFLINRAEIIKERNSWNYYGAHFSEPMLV